MSILKMRAWDKENKKFIPIKSLIFDVNCVLIGKNFWEQPIISRSYMNQTIITTHSDLFDNTEFNDLTEKEQIAWISKYPENKPENWPGKKIFEGDIIKYKNKIAVIEFKFGIFGIMNKHKRQKTGEILDLITSVQEIMNLHNGVKVIGNIFENPDLAKKIKK